MYKPKIGIIIPTIRSLDFLQSWKDTFSQCIGIIVEDHPNKQIFVPQGHFSSTYHFTWEDVERELGENAWIIPRHNSGIRSYGFLKANQLGLDIIITMDDDCYPIDGEDFLARHIANLSLSAPQSWITTHPNSKYLYTRGFPYGVRSKLEAVVSHGLWNNILDLDAPTQLICTDTNIPDHPELTQFIPRNYFYTMCSMNLAFKTKVTPLMYFPLMGTDKYGKNWGYDRFDDIWAGIFSKKIIDHLNYSVVNGSPFVNHQKASNVFTNLKKEASGIEINEQMFNLVNEVILTSTDPKSCYLELAQKINFPKTEYFDQLRKAMIIWSSLF